MKLLILFLMIFNFYLSLKVLKRKKRYRKNRKGKIINIGSSHSRDCLKAMKVNEKEWLDLSYASQTFYFDYESLKKYKALLEEESIIFLNISYFSFAPKFMWGKNSEEDYFKRFDFKEFQGKYKLKYLLYVYFPIFKYLKNKVNSLKKIEFNNEEVERTKRIKGHVKKLEENRNKEYNIFLLKKVIRFCKENNYKLIFITSPFKKEYNDYFSKELLENNFYKIIYDTINNENILYLDFSHDYKNFDEERYFDDYDHLSFEGSKKFLQELSKKLGINLV